MADPVQKIFDDIENPSLNGVPVTGMKKAGRRGRPSLEEYLEPEETEEIAVTSEKIMENYPFFGTLLKKENGNFRRKEVISRNQPKTIEDIERLYEAGSFQVRLKREDGSEDQINFTIADSNPQTQQPVNSSQKIDQQFIQSMRNEIREETRNELNDIILSLEKRLKSKDGELDDMTGKIRRLTVELTDIERQSNSMVRSETSTFQNKIEELKEEITELKFESFELQQELKYADVDTGFDLKETLNDALKNPDLFKLIAPFLAKFQSQHPAALAGPAAPEPAPTPDQPKKNETFSDKEPDMQHTINQFFSSVVQTVTSAMVNGTPGPEGIQKTVNEGLRSLTSNGIKPEPGLWIGISKTLIEVALQNNVTAQKAAETISPVLQQVNGAADQLKYISPGMATEYIINRFGIEVTAPQKEFLSEVLKVFKAQIKTN